ncbi:Putative_reverse transcriptase/endonuclease [Hexamita inflata]|uniref:Reverse transcriptase/endonuclease n=1 Tax=Hexamita inflata TaxID=28002 RepID=A0AA86P8E9_9EUKA|nr:Putative reverse transcriptase/endonuclease [Hexamita inflata]
MILAVFSSCLKTRLMQQVDIHEHQFCFKSGSFKSGGITHLVLPKVNYAPLVDFALKTPLDSFDNQYGPIDQMVFKYASDLFAVKDLSETEQADFFTNAASKGGLEMVVPSLYYDFMQAQQKAVLAGGVGIFKALRADYLKTLQDYPGVPAIGYAINNFTYLTDNELFDIIKHRFQVLNKELDSDSKCLLCGNRMTTQHEIKCNRIFGVKSLMQVQLAVNIRYQYVRLISFSKGFTSCSRPLIMRRSNCLSQQRHRFFVHCRRTTCLVRKYIYNYPS